MQPIALKNYLRKGILLKWADRRGKYIIQESKFEETGADRSVFGQTGQGMCRISGVMK